ncbi:MAG: hypothetical protein II998_12765 [Clostridia bacterium]|nr:hypothetical protein [Clostridia bacterium]
MTVFMIAFLAYLMYVSYCKVVCLCFRGKQHNRFFATLINTVIPFFGSIPAFIMASKYERRVNSVTSRVNDDIFRYVIIALQMSSVFLLFLPFYKQDGIYADGVNLIFGLSVGGETIFESVGVLIFLIILPFISAIVNSIDLKYNIRNVLSYASALICCITVFAVSVFLNMFSDFSVEISMWMYCVVNVTIMLLSFFSLVNVRNKFLLNLEEEEKEELITIQKSKAKQFKEEVIPEDSYKCAKCGNYVVKGTICSCRKNSPATLNTLMVAQNKKETSDFCVYCRRPLEVGEVCNCAGDGFGITVKPEQFNGRKCRYCGQVLIGDSLCVCEKIMKKSSPLSSDKEDKTELYSPMRGDMAKRHISDEMAELEEKINSKFTRIKSTFEKNGDINASAEEKKTDIKTDEETSTRLKSTFKKPTGL